MVATALKDIYRAVDATSAEAAGHEVKTASFPYLASGMARAYGQTEGSVKLVAATSGKLLGDTEGYSRPLAIRPRGKLSSGGGNSAAAVLPCLSVADCLHYTLTCDPDVTLLGLSFPNEQDAAYAAARNFLPLTPSRLADIRQRAAQAIAGKGNCWWNPPAA